MRKLIFILLIFIGVQSRAQQMQFTLTDSIPGKYTSFAVDNFGRIALVKNDVILSFSNQLDTLFSTSLKSFRPTYIESSKSFRTLVFDQERSVIHFLDNTMTDIHGEIDLVNQDIQQAWLVCESFGGNAFWVFDAGSMRLIKLNENLDKLIITENLASVFSSEILPSYMMEAHDLLFILIPNTGIAVFDVFGTYVKTFPFSTAHFDVFNEHLLLRENNTIRATPIKFDSRPDQYFEFADSILQFKFKQDKVYFLTPEGLMIGGY